MIDETDSVQKRQDCSSTDRHPAPHSLAQVGHSFAASCQSGLNQIELIDLAELAGPFGVPKPESPVLGSDYFHDVGHRKFLKAKAIGKRRLQQ